MRYLLQYYDDPTTAPEPGSPEDAAEFAAWMAFDAALTEAGVHAGGEALHGPRDATTVRVRDGRTLTLDGPFAETKEVLGGYHVIDVPDLDEAVRWAEKVPSVTRGSVEVRPVLELPPTGG